MADEHESGYHQSGEHSMAERGMAERSMAEHDRVEASDDVGLALFDRADTSTDTDTNTDTNTNTNTNTDTDTSTDTDAGAARERRIALFAPMRKWKLKIGLAILAILATTGAVLMAVGGGSVKPPPAPLPAHAFSYTKLPALPAGEQVPAPGSSPAPSGAPGSTGRGGGSTGGGGGSTGGGNGSPWTFSETSHLYIQSLNIDAPIVDDPTQRDELIGPGNVKLVGRWTGGASLDSTSGTVDLAGHVNYIGQGNGALYNLYQVAAGAVVVTTDGAGVRTPWRVTALQVVPKDALPASLFAATGPRTLKIVTCGGDLVHVSAPGGGYYTYTDNVIATAVPLTVTQ